ncbi:hypothetical protein [Halalkalibacillus sediminis]|nr:hypothetical protein [Halalkalibacillus sediminis]
MTKLLIGLLSVSLVLGGCGSSENPNGDQNSSGSEEVNYSYNQ